MKSWEIETIIERCATAAASISTEEYGTHDERVKLQYFLSTNVYNRILALRSEFDNQYSELSNACEQDEGA